MPLHFLLPTGAAEGDTQPGDVVVLTGAEAHHAAAVRRLRVGEEVTVGDGRGMWLTGRCESVSAGEVRVSVTARADAAAPSPRIVLAQALAKGDRDELAVQAATELGVDEIIPWQASRSVSRWTAGADAGKGKADKGRDRWQAIAREAAKQAHRPWLAAVSPLASAAALAERAATSRALVLEPSAADRLTEAALHTETRDILLIVGPEGGLAAEEIALFAQAGATPVRLGDAVLRTSTAGPAAIAVVSAALGRW